MNAPVIERERAAQCSRCRRLIVWTVELDCRRADCETVALLAEARRVRAEALR